MSAVVQSKLNIITIFFELNYILQGRPQLLNLVCQCQATLLMALSPLVAELPLPLEKEVETPHDPVLRLGVIAHLTHATVADLRGIVTLGHPLMIGGGIIHHPGQSS